MTTLSTDRPLGALLDVARAAGRPLSQRDLGELRQPRVTKEAVQAAVAEGARIKVETLLLYAAAVGYKVVISVEPIAALGEPRP